MTAGPEISPLPALILQTTQTTVSAFIGGFRTLSVPDFQRDYAWDETAVQVFIDDIDRCRRRRRTQKSKPHFFGAVVTSPGALKGTSRPHLIIIDGQQRLATIFMFITALRRKYQSAADIARDGGDRAELAAYFSSRASNLIAGFERASDIEFKSQKSVRKLVLNKADDPFFEQLLASEERAPRRASHLRLEEANKAIESYLDKLLARSENDEDTQSVLDSLYNGFLNDWLIVQLATGSDAEAHRIYRVLNNRGVPVSNCDLLRASTLEFVGRKLVSADLEAMAQAWDQILAGNQIEPDMALDAAFCSRSGLARSKGGPIEQIEEVLFPYLQSDEKPTEDEAKEVLRQVSLLRTDVEGLSKIAGGNICQGEHRNFTPVFKSRFDALTTVLKQNYCFPLLHAASILDPAAYVRVCDLIERFAFRYGVVVRAKIHAVEPVFQRHIHTLRTTPAEFRISALKDDLAQLIAEFAGDAMFRERLLAMEYGRDTKKPLRYVLVMIEHMHRWYEGNPQGTPACRDQTRVVDFHSITLEHIEASNAANLDPDLRPFINSIGNLTVMSQLENDAVANNSFDRKRIVFSESDLAINRAIGACEQWNLASYRARRDDLLDRCVAIFKI